MRTRIARELHDTLLQSFQGSLYRFQAARNLFSRVPRTPSKRSIRQSPAETPQLPRDARPSKTCEPDRQSAVSKNCSPSPVRNFRPSRMGTVVAASR